MHHKQKLYTNPNLIIAFSITLIVVMGVTNITPALPAMATFLISLIHRFPVNHCFYHARN
jgi:hypothetical protein